MRKNDLMSDSDFVEQEVSRRLRRVRERLFIAHLCLFLLFLVSNFFYGPRNLFAFLDGAFSLQESPIVLYMFVGWCIGLALHGVSVFFARDMYRDRLRRRVIQQYRRQNEAQLPVEDEPFTKPKRLEQRDDVEPGNDGELVNVHPQSARMLERR